MKRTTTKRRYTRRSSTVTTRATSQDRSGPASIAPAVEKTEAPVELSAKLKRIIDGVRAEFRGFSSQFSEMTMSRTELATPFMKAAQAFMAETELGFIDFVRQLDPTVPKDREGYRKHKSYQAADNLARLYRQLHKPKAKRGPKAASPLEGMARLISSVLPLIGADQVERLWAVVEKELHWSERKLTALQGRVKDAEPLLNVRGPRGAGGSIPQLRIAVPRGSHLQDADDATEEARTGTHG